MPDRGELPADYDIGHVIVRQSGSARSSTSAYHLADSADPDQPRCDTPLISDRTTWERVSVAELSWRYDLCERCDPRVEIDTGRGADDEPDSISEMRASQIRQAVREGDIDAETVLGGDGQ